MAKTKRKTAAKKIDPLLIHELLHGSFLAQSLLDKAIEGECYEAVFKQYPEIAKAAFNAQMAVADLYVKIGSIDE